MNDTMVEKGILDAARKTFIKKGKSGTTMQEIADVAGVNKALIHYYYRNKETLFQKIYEEALKDLGNSVYSVSTQAKNAEEFLQIIIDRTFAYQQEHKNYLLFFLWETKSETFEIANYANRMQKVLGYCPYDVFYPIVESAKKSGEIKDVNPQDLVINVISLIISFYIALPILAATFNYSENEIDIMVEERKREIFRLIWNDIKA